MVTILTVDDTLRRCSSFSSLLIVGLLVVLFFFSVTSVQAQDVTHFTSQDVFELPAVKGLIRFSGNGTYVDATVNNDMWIFTNLTLEGSRFSGTLKFSAKNCNVTIHSFRSNNVRYTVEGVGEQVIDLGLNSSRPFHTSEWSVLNQNSEFFAEGKYWELLSDNSVVVRGLLGTLTVMYYNYGYPVSDQTFYLQHHVLILTGVVVVVTVTVASVIKLKSKRVS